tara:strand:+ start:45 stop:1481 length:1437 start_codon:yes stop_codon:yes gene_type:complete
MSILSPKPRKNPDGTVLYKGKIYASENDPNFIRIMSIEREQKDAANRANLQSLTNPNNITAGQVRLNAANELSALQNLQNARMNGMPVARNTNDIIMNNNRVANNKPMNLLGLNANTPNVNINANSLLPSQNVAQQNVNTQNQNSQNTSKTGGFRNFFNRANESFQNAAPIFAVAQEFRKAGAPRAVGAPMQGDPYGKMMQIQQGRKEASNIASLRAKYGDRIPQELNDKDFVDTVKKIINEDIKNSGSRNNKELIKDAKINTGLEENQKEGLGNAKSAFGAGSTVLSAVGSVGEYTPYGGNFAVQTQKARSAVNANAVNTKQFFNNAASLGRIAKYTVQSINNLIPVEFASDGSTITGYKSEKKALEDYQNLRSFVQRTVTQLENQLLNPDSELTKAKKNDFVAAINSGSQLLKEYDRLIGSLKGEIKGTDDNAGAKNRTYDSSLLPPDPNQTRESAMQVVYGKGQYDIVANAMGVK